MQTHNFLTIRSKIFEKYFFEIIALFSYRGCQTLSSDMQTKNGRYIISTQIVCNAACVQGKRSCKHEREMCLCILYKKIKQ